MSRMTLIHKETITEYLERNRVMVSWRTQSVDPQEITRLWKTLEDRLNRLGGVPRSVDSWRKAWSEALGRVKKQARDSLTYMRGTGGGPPRKGLSRLEERMLTLAGGATVIAGLGRELSGMPSQGHESLLASPVGLRRSPRLGLGSPASASRTSGAFPSFGARAVGQATAARSPFASPTSTGRRPSATRRSISFTHAELEGVCSARSPTSRDGGERLPPPNVRRETAARDDDSIVVALDSSRATAATPATRPTPLRPAGTARRSRATQRPFAESAAARVEGIARSSAAASAASAAAVNGQAAATRALAEATAAHAAAAERQAAAAERQATAIAELARVMGRRSTDSGSSSPTDRFCDSRQRTSTRKRQRMASPSQII